MYAAPLISLFHSSEEGFKTLGQLEGLRDQLHVFQVFFIHSEKTLEAKDLSS